MKNPNFPRLMNLHEKFSRDSDEVIYIAPDRDFWTILILKNELIQSN